ncbi:hypothetical protein GOBAR_DD02575 [Gossypium barbadense]|nr:hypothetical protein GOBAR_DD02575 [Gossypium barbadense]
MGGFRGQAMCFTYWKAAKVTFSRQIAKAMSKMKSLLESTEAWLRNKDPRLGQEPTSQPNIILEAKDKPILTMLEIIRRKFMTRLVSMREAVEKYPRPLCPTIQNKLPEIVSQSN